MKTPGLNDFIYRVLDLFAQHDVHGELFWWTRGEYAPITFLVNCNDLFVWGCSDAERLTPETLPELEQAFADADAAGAAMYGPELYCARRRKMRPQGAAYPDMAYPMPVLERLWDLFDACGPAREVGLGNPKRPPRERPKP